jgi:hypothetical protein
MRARKPSDNKRELVIDHSGRHGTHFLDEPGRIWPIERTDGSFHLA